jgi:hypothetical protein
VTGMPPTGWVLEEPGAALGAEHPFLEHGRYRAFAASGARGQARLIASLDRRQVEVGRPVGAVGSIEAGDAHAFDAALAAGLDWLSQEGARVARCPVQLSTWYGHRAVTERFVDEGGPPPFLLEPQNARWLPDMLVARGFAPGVRSVSHVVPNERAIAGTEPALRRATDRGFRDRPLRLDQARSELRLLHRLSSVIFAEAWGFSPMSPAEFLYLYEPLLGLVDPELVRILEAPDGEAVGFVFAIPDRLGASAGNPDARFVLKTIGVLPGTRRTFPGLGSALVARVHGLAGERGYPTGIHALMAVPSEAQRISSRWGSLLRGYATFVRAL